MAHVLNCGVDLEPLEGLGRFALEQHHLFDALFGCGPECVKTLWVSSSWIIDVRWLSDRTVNAAGRLGGPGIRQRRFTVSGTGKNQLLLG